MRTRCSNFSNISVKKRITMFSLIKLERGHLLILVLFFSIQQVKQTKLIMLTPSQAQQRR